MGRKREEEEEEEEEEDKEGNRRRPKNKQRCCLRALDKAREADEAQSGGDFSSLVLATIFDCFYRKIPS